MKVALVIYGSLETISGGYLFDRMLVARLRLRGDEVEIISMPRRSYAASLIDNLTFRTLPGFDLILQDELNHPSLFLANRRAHRAAIISIVHHLRSSERRASWQNAIYRGVERRYLESVDGFIFNSEVTRASVERLIGPPGVHVVATPGGDRLGSSTHAQVMRRAQQPGPLRIICLGSLSPGKGVDVLLDALSLVPREAVHLQIVGPESAAPGFARRMRGKAAALQLPVEFCGPLDDRPLEHSLRNAQVMVLPSYYEGFGIAYLEGMAHGLPALGTRAGAIPDLVSEGVNGYLVEPGDAAALADRIMTLTTDRGLLARLGGAALAAFREFPTWDESTERMRDFLLGVASARESGRP